MSKQSTGSWTVCIGTPLLGVLLSLTACGYSQEQWQGQLDRVAGLQAELQQTQEREALLGSRLEVQQSQLERLQSKLNAAGRARKLLETSRGSLQSELRSKEERLAELERRERQAQEQARQFKSSLQSMIDSGQLKVGIVRGRLVVQLSDSILFDSGQSELKEEGAEALAQVADALGVLTDRDFQVTGHTDDVDINTARFPSNWELSTARAVTVTRFLMNQGMDPARLSAAGYAEYQPLASNGGEVGRRVNRRIEIVLQPDLEALHELFGGAGSL